MGGRRVGLDQKEGLAAPVLGATEVKRSDETGELVSGEMSEVWSQRSTSGFGD